jgi:ornithine cyclodeaminase
MEVLIMNHEQVVQSLPMPQCIETMAEALECLAKGEGYMPVRMMVRPPATSSLMALMPAYRSGHQPVYGLKTICMFPGNAEMGKDIHQGSVQLFSGENGELLAVVNGSAITAIRTAAVSAVATRLLAREDAGDVALIGAGRQGRAHLAAMAAVRRLKRVRVADCVFERTQKFVEEMSPQYDFPIEAVPSVEAAVRNADIVVTITTSGKPVVRREWVSNGAHLNVVGASLPNAREVDGATVAASKLFVDRRESTLKESGDYLLALQEGAIGPDHIRGEIGELLLGKVQGRTSDRDITMFKALGLAIEDVVAAQFLYEQARQKRSGTWVDF